MFKKKEEEEDKGVRGNLLKPFLHQSHSPMPISQVHNHMRKSLNDTQEMKMTGQSIFPTSEHFSAQILRQPYFNGQL